MNHAHRLTWWLLGIVTLTAFGLADISAVALAAATISVGQLVVSAAAFTLTAGGALYTVWWFE
jgi:hypothetical protein